MVVSTQEQLAVENSPDTKKIYPTLYIPEIREEDNIHIAFHGRGGGGKSTGAFDVALWAIEHGLVSGLATNLPLTEFCRQSLKTSVLQYITDLETTSDCVDIVDEMDRAVDGRKSMTDLFRDRLNRMVNDCRRRRNKVMLYTSIGGTGIDNRIRECVRIIIGATGEMDFEGYPIYRVFYSYEDYFNWRRDPLKAKYTFCRGFHKVEELKKYFLSMTTVKLQAYPPLDLEKEADLFSEWGKSFLFNEKGKLVPLEWLRIHVRTWNAESHSLPYFEYDLEHILSVVKARQDREVK